MTPERNEERRLEIANQIGTIEAQLEGLFRQCFQACQQRQFAGYFSQHAPMIEQIGLHIDQLQNLVKEHIFLKQNENVETPSQEEMN